MRRSRHVCGSRQANYFLISFLAVANAKNSPTKHRRRFIAELSNFTIHDRTAKPGFID